MPLSPNFNNRDLKNRRLSPRDKDLYILLGMAATAVSGNSEATIWTEDNGERTVYRAKLVLEAFAMGYRGSMNQLLQSVQKRGGLIRKYKIADVGKCPEAEGETNAKTT